MYNIDIICVGKLKEDYLRGACAEYSKRLSAFCKLKITELTPARIPDDPSEVPMYMQLPLLEEKSGQNFAMFCSFKKSCAGMTDAGFLHLYF